MSISEKLDIVLITYNRKEALKNTLEQILTENSPIKNFKITILNNNSTDGSTELINEYCEKYKNLSHIINPKNVGGCANIAKALVELPKKDYIWVISDNDKYDWTVWNKIEQAVIEEYDVVFTRNCNNSIADMYRKASLISGCIYKTKNITETVTENIYDSIHNLFPHLAVFAKNVNDNNSIYIPNKNLVIIKNNPNQNLSYTRGLEINDLPDSRKYIYWQVGYFNSLELIKDKNKRYEIINGTTQAHKSVFELFKATIIQNKIYYNNYSYNLKQIFRMLNFQQKFKFILAYLIVNLSLKNYKFYEMQNKEEWIDYFKTINEQKYINRLGKKYKNKRILLYGAGITAEALLETCNLSGINIVGISDIRFQQSNEQDFCGIKTIKPSLLNNKDFDTILFTMKLYRKAEKSLKEQGIKAKMCSVIKKDFKYSVRT